MYRVEYFRSRCRNEHLPIAMPTVSHADYLNGNLQVRITRRASAEPADNYPLCAGFRDQMHNHEAIAKVHNIGARVIRSTHCRAP